MRAFSDLLTDLARWWRGWWPYPNTAECPPASTAPTVSKQRNPWRLKQLLGALDEIERALAASQRGESHVDLSATMIHKMRRIGVYVVSRFDVSLAAELPLPADLPAFGAIYLWPGLFGDDEPPDNAVRFVAFLRLDRCPWDVRASRGQIFHVVTAIVEAGKTVWSGYYAAINGGRIEAVPAMVNEIVALGRHRSYHRRAWSTSAYQRVVSEGDGERPMWAGALATAINTWRLQDGGWQVIASRLTTRLRFTIPQHRVVDFFRERLLEPASDGKRKRILHAVRPHQRRTGSLVRWHLRGTHSFHWHQWICEIIVPGHQGKSLPEFACDAVVIEEGEAMPVGVLADGKVFDSLPAFERLRARH